MPSRAAQALFSCGALFHSLKLLVHGLADSRVRDGSVHQRRAVHNCDGVEHSLALDLGDDAAMSFAILGLCDREVLDAGARAVADVELSCDQCCDLLRSPGGTSTAAEAVRERGTIEYLYGYGIHECS